MTNKEILKLAIKVGFSLDEDDGTWFCFEEELLKFALAIHENGYNKGYDRGCEDCYESAPEAQKYIDKVWHDAIYKNLNKND